MVVEDSVTYPFGPVSFEIDAFRARPGGVRKRPRPAPYRETTRFEASFLLMLITTSFCSVISATERTHGDGQGALRDKAETQIGPGHAVSETLSCATRLQKQPQRRVIQRTITSRFLPAIAMRMCI